MNKQILRRAMRGLPSGEWHRVSLPDGTALIKRNINRESAPINVVRIDPRTWVSDHWLLTDKGELRSAGNTRTTKEHRELWGC